jgi:hypothetical protein
MNKLNTYQASEAYAGNCIGVVKTYLIYDIAMQVNVSGF